MIYTWNLDPVALSLFGLDIRWYGIAYLLGFYITLKYLESNRKKKLPTLTKDQLESFIFSTFFIGVLGGRIGEFIFYSPATFFTDPLEILKIWHGGMSIHGGFLAALLWGFFWTRKNKISFWILADIIVIPLAIALVLGRAANFINGELVGIPTDQTWGVIFPHVDNLLRHPSQLYEVVKNLTIAAILIGIKNKFSPKPGMLFLSFIFFYGFFRFFIEYFRTPDGIIGIFSTGQVLCLFMIFMSLFLCFTKK